MLQCRLRRDVNATDVDIDHSIHFFQGRLLERLRNGRAGIVHQDIQSAESRESLFDRGLDSDGIGRVRLNRDRLSAGALDFLNDRRGSVGAFGVSKRHARPVVCQPLGNRRANSS